ncbi:MAG TPA: molybdopterin cofactor-binding domain-containing protein [Stellaceae bacterium]|jgi:CO/xanthine dehydrogenase Mo-binding subunit|nr:molybdopterin cofactor-binding domain-containing protein [Stellaceae bacterium]
MTCRHPAEAGPSRRGFLAGGGALIVSFSLLPRFAAAQAAGQTGPALPGSLAKFPMLDSWVRIDANGAITVFTGKAELGQGIKTALIQLAAEELIVTTEAIDLVTADTARTPDEGYTAGSHSMQDSGTAIRNAAAQARALLIDAAATRLQVPGDKLRAENGMVIAEDGRQLRYGELVGDQILHVQASPQSVFVDPSRYRFIGKPVPRVDIPAKVTGGIAFIQDMRLPNMAHARLVRPPSYGATLSRLDTAAVEHLPGVIKIVRDGSYLAVIAEQEYQAIVAMRALETAAHWDEKPGLPDSATLFDTLAGLPAQQVPVRDDPIAIPPNARIVEASYRRAYHMHGSIGPSCAIGLSENGALTVWTHAQGVFPLRAALTELTGLPRDKVRCIHVQGSGCYGHNGADDAGADAALLALALPGRPVRVQWMREQEHIWEPYGSAMLTKARAALSPEHQIIAWDYTVRSSTHATRPGGAGNLMPAWYREKPLTQPVPKPLPLPEGGGHRNAAPIYTIPSARVMYEFMPAMPLRVSALRGLGAYMNVFSIESFMDELAQAAGLDPVDFRLNHLSDPRAREVVTRAAERFGWLGFSRTPGTGRGFGFARYKNLAAYLAVAVEVAVDRESGQVRMVRAAAAVDSGEAVNPDGIANQIEGSILQSASWTLYESVAFDRTRIASRDWSSYPIMRFPAVPDRIEVQVVERPGEPFLGTGEAAQGPTAAAVANAVADAIGVRLRDIPLSPAQVKAAIGV